MPFRERVRRLLGRIRKNRQSVRSINYDEYVGRASTRDIRHPTAAEEAEETDDAVPPPIPRCSQQTVRTAKSRTSADGGSVLRNGMKSMGRPAEPESKCLYSPEPECLYSPEPVAEPALVVRMSALGPGSESRPQTSESETSRYTEEERREESGEHQTYASEGHYHPLARSTSWDSAKGSEEERPAAFRCNTNNTSNTIISSDAIENFAATRSLEPSPLKPRDQTADEYVAPPKPARQAHSDGIDAFAKGPTLSGVRRVPTLDYRRSSYSADTTGIEESVFMRRLSLGTRMVDTERTLKTNKPIVHEKIRPVEREERTEVVTREHHYHHFYPCIQPIVDRYYLPTKHYLQTEEGVLQEISAAEAALYGEPIWRGEEIIAGDDYVESTLGLERQASIRSHRDAQGNRVDEVVEGRHEVMLVSRRAHRFPMLGYSGGESAPSTPCLSRYVSAEEEVPGVREDYGVSMEWPSPAPDPREITRSASSAKPQLRVRSPSAGARSSKGSISDSRDSEVPPPPMLPGTWVEDNRSEKSASIPQSPLLPPGPPPIPQRSPSRQLKKQQQEAVQKLQELKHNEEEDECEIANRYRDSGHAYVTPPSPAYTTAKTGSRYYPRHSTDTSTGQAPRYVQEASIEGPAVNEYDPGKGRRWSYEHEPLLI